MFTATESRAGFVMKKKMPAVEVVTMGTSCEAVQKTATFATRHESTHKHSLFSKIWHAVKPDSDNIPKPLYVVLSIIWLGWLAMGINDNFEGWDWVISLILYLLFWLPGVIYSLIMMKKYY